MLRVEGRPRLFWSRALLRLLQFAFSLIALATLSAAFVSTSCYGCSSILGSRAVIFATLMTYTGMVYGLWFLLAIIVARMCGRPPLFIEQLLDFLLAVLLLIAAIVLLVSDYVRNCSVYDYMLRCKSIHTAIVFMFLAMASFLATLLLNFCEYGKSKNGDDTVSNTARTHQSNVEHDSEGPASAPYYNESTPTARGPAGHPSTRV